MIMRHHAIELQRRQPARTTRLILGAVALLLVTGCSTVSFLEEDEQLYVRPSVTVTPESDVRRRRALESDLFDTLRPIPNTAWFGVLRPWLWVYSVVGTPEEEGLRSWIADRFGEEPVLFSEVSPHRLATAMQTWLFNHGFFESEVEWEIRERGARRATVDYEVTVASPFRFLGLEFPQGDGDLEEAIAATRADSLIVAGDVYSLETLRAERVRIDRTLKNQGFFAFTPEYLLFEAERDLEARTVSLRLTVQPDTPDSARVRYTIGSVTIFADHSPGGSGIPDDASVIELGDDYRYVQRRERYRPEVIASAILFNPGDTFSRVQHVNSINRLMSLGVFRFVNIRYEQDPQEGVLHAEVLLSPLREKTIEGEIQAVTRSDGFAGPGAAVRYRDRNTFSGAETLTVDLNTGFETLLGNGNWAIDSYEIGLEGVLAVPRIIAPFGRWADGRGAVMPRTTLRTGFSTLTRVDTYRLDQFSTSLGYQWSPQSSIRHELRPVEVTLVRPLDFSASFQEVLDANPTLARSFDEQLIIGGSYRVVYSDRNPVRSEAQHYLSGQVELAGNLLSLVKAQTTGRSPDADDPFTVLEIPYSQFVRLDSDSRYFVPLSDATMLVGRVLAGGGYPLGNSSSLPRVKQFTVGGTNSIRAFLGRSFGPGTVAPESAGGPAVERSSDLRLEMNLEYRFGIWGMVKGALFVDAGNIWSLDPEANEATGGFQIDRILEESAVGAGFGIRFDPQIVVVRLDIATPLREPWREPGDRWVAGAIDPLDRQWRRNNLVFNIAIGYPF